MFMAPMLMSKQEEPFDDSEYIFEPMIDGHRLLLSFIGSKARLYTKHHNDVTRQYPELLKVPLRRPADVILDGEVAYIDPTTGVEQFETLIERYRMNRTPRIREGSIQWPVRFFIFDILYYNGVDMRKRPLMERKRLLNELLDNNAYYHKMIYIEAEGQALFDVIRERQLEGIAGKRKDSLYEEGHSGNWLKIVNYRYEDIQIAGWRKDRLGWLAQVDGKTVAIIEDAITPAQRRQLQQAAVICGEDRDFVYAEPSLTATVRYRSLNRNGMMRRTELVALHDSSPIKQPLSGDINKRDEA